VTLVERLGQGQCVLGGKGSFALERGEVVELRRNLFGGLFLFADDAGLARAAGSDGRCAGLVPDALGAAMRQGRIFFEVRIDPFAGVAALGYREVGVHLPVVLRLEGLDFTLALGEDRQRGGLYAARCGDVKPAMAGTEAGEGAGGVEPHQPVRLRAALGGIGQMLHLRAVAELVPGFLDGVGRHGLHPQPLDRLADPADVHDVLKNQLALPPGVTGVDDHVELFFLRESQNMLEAALCLFDRLQFEGFGDGRQHLEFPGQVLAVGPGRHFQLNQVPDCGSDGRLIIFKVLCIPRLAFFTELAEPAGKCLGQVGGNGGFFGNDQIFHVVGAATGGKAACPGNRIGAIQILR